mgnify:CR=1 FL=1
MAKKKSPKKKASSIEDMTINVNVSGKGKGRKLDPNERDYEITSASIKDMLCNYEITVTGEENHGDKMKVAGSGIIDRDMLTAMARFNVHFACIDDAFKTAGVEFEDIDTMRGHELTANYVVSGFKIKGGAGNESLILIGTKYVSQAGDHMQLQTPKIPLSQSSSYAWYNELSDVCELIREEVSLYREGKYTEKEPIEKEDPNQIEMFKVDNDSDTGLDDEQKAETPADLENDAADLELTKQE